MGPPAGGPIRHRIVKLARSGVAFSGTLKLVTALLALVLLHGIVVRGPTQPVCQVGKPCSAPAVGVVLVFARSGYVAARVTTVKGGKYSVRLAPGSYTVSTVPRQKIGAGIRPSEVRVRGPAAVNFYIDTGIR